MRSQFSYSVMSLCVPMTTARQASLSITNSWGLIKLMSIELVMPSSHLILCHSLLLLPSIFPSIRLFFNESVLHTRWLKYWSFSFGINPSSEYSGLISFSIDWWNLPIYLSFSLIYIYIYIYTHTYIYTHALIFVHSVRKDFKDLEKECSLGLVKNTSLLFLVELERLKSWKAKDLRLLLLSSHSSIFSLDIVKAITFFSLEFFAYSPLELHNDPTFLELYHLKNWTFVEHEPKLAFSHIF